MIIVSTGSGTVTNINTALPLSGGPITTSGTITTSMATNKLIGRSTAGTGVMEEITVGTGLSLTGGTLSSTGGGAAGSTNEIQFNNAAAFAASANLRWIIADNRLLLGTENTADTNSRMVIIGKGISTQNTFAVHNSTGTNNALVVRDDSFIRFGASAFTSISAANQQWEFGAGAGRKVLTIQGNNSTAQPSFIRFQIDDGGSANKAILFDNNNGVGGIGTQIINFGSTPSTLFIQNAASTTLQQLEIRDNNSTGRAVLSAGNTSAQLILVRSGTVSIRIQDDNSTDSWWNPTGVRTFIFGATTRTNASALVEMTSTTRGFLPPRMSTGDINNINTPATGLTVYNTTENTLCFYNGTSWQKLSHSNL